MRWIWGEFSRVGLVWAVMTLVFDQISKYWIVHIYQLPSKGTVPVMPFVDLVMVWNDGISYGLFKQSSQEGQLFLVGLAVAAIVALWIWLAQSDSLLPSISLGLVLGGAAGNAIDRGVYGAVADFVSLYGFGYNWYVFNVADVAIVAGVSGLLYDAVFPSRKKVSNAS